MWQLKIYTFIMRCLILLFVAFHSFSMFTIFLNAIANLCMILFYLRQLLSMTQYILNYSHFLFLHKFNLRWLRNSFLWHAVADICCLACGSKMLFSIIFTTSPLAKSWIRAWFYSTGKRVIIFAIPGQIAKGSIRPDRSTSLCLYIYDNILDP